MAGDGVKATTPEGVRPSVAQGNTASRPKQLTPEPPPGKQTWQPQGANGGPCRPAQDEFLPGPPPSGRGTVQWAMSRAGALVEPCDGAPGPSQLIALAERVGANLSSVGGELGMEERAWLAMLRGPHARVYAKALQGLLALSEGKTNAAGFTLQVMKDCAAEARTEKEPGRRNQLFLELVRTCLSATPFWNVEGSLASQLGGSVYETVRGSLTGGGRVTGGLIDAWLSPAASAGAARQGKALDEAHLGFNPNVLDSQDPTFNTVSHHLVEYMLLGSRLGDGAMGETVAKFRDSSEENAGDLRCALLGNMVGAGLSNGSLTPDQAVALLESAVSAQSGAVPPWGAQANSEPRFFSAQGYPLDAWMAAAGLGVGQ